MIDDVKYRLLSTHETLRNRMMRVLLAGSALSDVGYYIFRGGSFTGDGRDGEAESDLGVGSTYFKVAVSDSMSIEFLEILMHFEGIAAHLMKGMYDHLFCGKVLDVPVLVDRVKDLRKVVEVSENILGRLNG